MFSVLIVSLNAGADLDKTVSSALAQDYPHYEVIVKDGLSEDGMVERLICSSRLRIYRNKDRGIYDAMNQAIEYMQGQYAIYLNCGDTFYTPTVLSEVAKNIRKIGADIYYGDNFTENRSVILRAPRKITNYTCFTKILCQQSTFYSTDLLRKRSFDMRYRVAADAHLYISAYKCDGARIKYIPVVVSSYKGGGFSETPINKKLGLSEHRQILKEVFNGHEYFRNRCFQFITLNLLKQCLSGQVWFKKYYNRIASIVYVIKNKAYNTHV